jgi:hypothetical protein
MRPTPSAAFALSRLDDPAMAHVRVAICCGPSPYLSTTMSRRRLCTAAGVVDRVADLPRFAKPCLDEGTDGGVPRCARGRPVVCQVMLKASVPGDA